LLNIFNKSIKQINGNDHHGFHFTQTGNRNPVLILDFFYLALDIIFYLFDVFVLYFYF